MEIEWFGFFIMELVGLDFYNINGASWYEDSCIGEMMHFYMFIYKLKGKIMGLIKTTS